MTEDMSVSIKEKADEQTNKLYASMRKKFGHINALANGYRSQKYFLAEQEILISTIDQDAKNIFDIGCGSGLILEPLLSDRINTIGIDFNHDACHAAYQNRLPVIRGDAYNLPIASNCIDQVTNCQFLNQQKLGSPNYLFKEIYRILKPGGSATIIWRNGTALIHRIAHVILVVYDLARSMPIFPQVNHRINDVCKQAKNSGFDLEIKELMFPLFRWRSKNINGFLGIVIGASCLIKIRKPK